MAKVLKNNEFREMNFPGEDLIFEKEHVYILGNLRARSVEATTLIVSGNVEVEFIKVKRSLFVTKRIEAKEIIAENKIEGGIIIADLIQTGGSIMAYFIKAQDIKTGGDIKCRYFIEGQSIEVGGRLEAGWYVKTKNIQAQRIEIEKDIKAESIKVSDYIEAEQIMAKKIEGKILYGTFILLE